MIDTVALRLLCWDRDTNPCSLTSLHAPQVRALTTYTTVAIHVILNGEPLEGVDCFKYLGSQVAANGGCDRDVVHRMNEGYRAWGELKSVLSNRGLQIKANKCLYEGVIVLTALYGAEGWGMRIEKCSENESKCS